MFQLIVCACVCDLCSGVAIGKMIAGTSGSFRMENGDHLL